MQTQHDVNDLLAYKRAVYWSSLQDVMVLWSQQSSVWPEKQIVKSHLASLGGEQSHHLVRALEAGHHKQQA